MRGAKAKQLRKAADSFPNKDVPARWVYKRLKKLYRDDPVTRSYYNL